MDAVLVLFYSPAGVGPQKPPPSLRRATRLGRETDPFGPEAQAAKDAELVIEAVPDKLDIKSSSEGTCRKQTPWPYEIEVPGTFRQVLR